MALLSAMISGLALWAWDMRQEVTQVQHILQEHVVLARLFQEMRAGAEERSIKLATLGQDLASLQQRVDLLAQRLLAVHGRLDHGRQALPVPPARSDRHAFEEDGP